MTGRGPINELKSAAGRSSEVTEDVQGTKAYLLDSFHESRQGVSVFYGIGRLESGETFGIIDDELRPAFYLRKSDLPLATKFLNERKIVLHPCALATMDGEAVLKAQVPTVAEQRRYVKALHSQGVRTHEGDLDYSLRFQIERQVLSSFIIKGPWFASHLSRIYRNPTLTAIDWQPPLSLLSLDIETDAKAKTIYGVGLVYSGQDKAERSEIMLVVGEPLGADPEHVRCYPNERQLLQALAAKIRELDPDIITGWNVIDFDLRVLLRKCQDYGLPFNIGRTKDTAHQVLSADDVGRRRGLVRGRQVLDGLSLMRGSGRTFDDYRLGTVANALLGRGKTLALEEWEFAPDAITRAYKEDRQAFADYCLEDARLVLDIHQATGLIELTAVRSQLVGLAMERAWGSIAAFESIYCRELRQRDIVAPSYGVDSSDVGETPGGLVLEPRTGLHPDVLVFDYKSLYPSLMRTFNIDPLSHARALGPQANEASKIVAPNGAAFDRQPGILPAMLDRLASRREEAKKAGDNLASYAYKIVMNSFYGVLATDSCRFAATDIAGAITTFGHRILRWTRDYFTERGFEVLYGDTDSLFVSGALLLGGDAQAAIAKGDEVCREANLALAAWLKATYGVASVLELEFEKYYRAMILPPARERTASRAKSYAGWKCDGAKTELEVIGMEAVRSDWTPLAQKLQRELLVKIFQGESAPAIERLISATVAAVTRSERDADLVYRKRIRKPLQDYIKSSPPHVKAARLLPGPVRVVRYVITKAGPQPLGFVTAALDYDHYIAKQIRPIVETLASIVPLDPACLESGGFRQRSLFDL